jgi:CheY-like chemotaxis protein
MCVGHTRRRAFGAACAAAEKEVSMVPKILVIDDSGTSQMIARQLLGTLAVSIESAKDGIEGIEQAEKVKPDLILLDVVMPRMDGFETCRQLRAREATRQTPILMVTTRGEEANVEKGFANGCTDYICKPFNAVELLTKVKSYLRT